MPYIIVGTDRLFYAARGKVDTTPVVFIHGAGGSRLIWGNQLADLAAVARPLAVDLPGHGRSGAAGRQSIGDYADVVIGFLQALALPLAVLVGHSMGGGITLTVALQRPDLLAGLVLVGTGSRLRVAPAILDGIQTDFAAAVNLVGQFAFGPGAAEKAVRLSEEAMTRTGPATLHGDFMACDKFDVTNRLAEIGLPTLVLCGAEDKLTPPKFSAFLGQHIAGAQVQIIPGAGHMVMLEQPQAVGQAIIQLLGKR